MTWKLKLCTSLQNNESRNIFAVRNKTCLLNGVNSVITLIEEV
jgi:hypothetical protein